VRAALAGLILAGMACGSPVSSRPYTILFSVRSDTGEPLGGVGIEVNGKVLGETGPEGGLEVELVAPEGKVLTVDTRCPAGYRSPQQFALRLRELAVLGDQQNHLTLSRECRPVIRRAAVLVHAPGRAELPILRHGVEVGRTDADGVAHLGFELEPGTAIKLSLDTSAQPRLRPQNPVHEFTIGDRDEIFLFSYQPTELPRPKPRPRAKPDPVLPVEMKSLLRRR
jgi:hypothetical protein